MPIYVLLSRVTDQGGPDDRGVHRQGQGVVATLIPRPPSQEVNPHGRAMVLGSLWGTVPVSGDVVMGSTCKLEVQQPRYVTGPTVDTSGQDLTLQNPLRTIGDLVNAGEPIAQVGDLILVAPISGVVRGVLHSGLLVRQGMKVVEVDPRPDPTIPFKIAERSLCIASGVVEALRLLSEGTRPP